MRTGYERASAAPGVSIHELKTTFSGPLTHTCRYNTYCRMCCILVGLGSPDAGAVERTSMLQVHNLTFEFVLENVHQYQLTTNISGQNIIGASNANVTSSDNGDADGVRTCKRRTRRVDRRRDLPKETSLKLSRRLVDP
jgi:hypothetical protein